MRDRFNLYEVTRVKTNFLFSNLSIVETYIYIWFSKFTCTYIAVTSPLTPKTTNTVSVVVSPTTPVNIPSTFSQAISTTQQIIDQTSILIEKQQFLISGNGDSHTPAHIQQFVSNCVC